MHTVLTTLENVVLILFGAAAWLSPFILPVFLINHYVTKPKKTLTVIPQTVGQVPEAFPNGLSTCPGLWIAVIGILLVIGPWLPIIVTAPPGTRMRPMGPLVMDVMICMGITYMATPVAALDVLRGIFSKRRSKKSRLWGVILGLVGIAAGLYASHLPHDLLWGLASWRGWVIEE